MKMTTDQLAATLKAHSEWLRGEGGSRAVLTRADLRDADLRDAVLTGADLTDADLTGADLRDAVLTDADLTGADLTGAVLTRADLTRAVGISAPAIPNIDAAILGAIEGGGKLNMGDWHTCETMHCRAGWAVTLAGLPGKMLEDRIGPAGAGALIYAASKPGVPVPDFYATDEDAMADIRKCAAEQLAAAQ